jgi:hypothetical protein
LISEPVDDARFIPVFAHSLGHTGGYAPIDARRIAATPLPNIMQFDPAVPLPSRKRARVQDQFLAILTNGRVTSDKAGPHQDLLPELPDVGPPHVRAAERFRPRDP